MSPYFVALATVTGKTYHFRSILKTLFLNPVSVTSTTGCSFALHGSSDRSYTFLPDDRSHGVDEHWQLDLSQHSLTKYILSSVDVLSTVLDSMRRSNRHQI